MNRGLVWYCGYCDNHVWDALAPFFSAPVSALKTLFTTPVLPILRDGELLNCSNCGAVFKVSIEPHMRGADPTKWSGKCVPRSAMPFPWQVS